MDGVGVTKTEQRVLTLVGVVVGLLIGFVVFQKIIGNRMIEAPRFVLAVLGGGVVGMVLYSLIKDGGVALLKRRTKTPAPAEVAPAPDQPVKARRSEPLRAKKRAAPAADDKPAASRPIKATRERPLRPPGRS